MAEQQKTERASNRTRPVSRRGLLGAVGAGAAVATGAAVAQAYGSQETTSPARPR